MAHACVVVSNCGCPLRRTPRYSGDQAQKSFLVVNVVALSLVMFAAAGGGLASFTGLPLLLLMFAAMYFLLIAPNQKKQKQWQSQLSAIKTGDRVTTNGGMRGTVVAVKDDVLVVRMQPDNLKFEIVKSAIAAVTTDEDTQKG